MVNKLLKFSNQDKNIKTIQHWIKKETIFFFRLDKIYA